MPVKRPKPKTSADAKSPCMVPYEHPALSLRDRRRGERQAFLVALAEPSLTDALVERSVFTTLIDLAINDYGVQQIELARTLGMSTAAVGRWTSGNSAPPAYARGQVVDAVSSLIKQSLAQETELDQDNH